MVRKAQRCSSSVDLAAGYVIGELKALELGFGNSAGHLGGVCEYHCVTTQADLTSAGETDL